MVPSFFPFSSSIFHSGTSRNVGQGGVLLVRFKKYLPFHNREDGLQSTAKSGVQATPNHGNPRVVVATQPKKELCVRNFNIASPMYNGTGISSSVNASLSNAIRIIKSFIHVGCGGGFSTASSSTSTTTTTTSVSEEILPPPYLLPLSTDPITLTLLVNYDSTRESVRGLCELPYPLPRRERLLVFCGEGEAATLRGLGADYAGGASLISRVAQGFTGFDKCLASPEMVPQIVKLAKVLGPLGLMPNPRGNTICVDLNQAVRNFKSGKNVDFKADLNGKIQLMVGFSHMEDIDIIKNMRAVTKAVLRERPTGAVAGGGQSSPTYRTAEHQRRRPPIRRHLLHYLKEDLQKMGIAEVEHSSERPITGSAGHPPSEFFKQALLSIKHVAPLNLNLSQLV